MLQSVIDERQGKTCVPTWIYGSKTQFHGMTHNPSMIWPLPLVLTSSLMIVLNLPCQKIFANFTLCHFTCYFLSMVCPQPTFAQQESSGSSFFSAQMSTLIKLH